MPELLSVLVDIPKVPSRIRTGGFLWNQAGAGILYGGSRRLREGRCCRHTSIPKIHGMIYTPPWNNRGTYVIELDKERKDCKENPFLQNQWEGKSNEEFVDGGAGDGRSAPCGGKRKE